MEMTKRQERKAREREEALNSMMDEDEGTVFALVFEARLAMLFINSKGLYDEWLQYCKKHRSELIDRLNEMVIKLLPHKEKKRGINRKVAR